MSLHLTILLPPLMLNNTPTRAATVPPFVDSLCILIGPLLSNEIAVFEIPTTTSLLEDGSSLENESSLEDGSSLELSLATLPTSGPVPCMSDKHCVSVAL